MSRAFQLLAVTPGLSKPSIALAAHRAGGTGILDFEFAADWPAAHRAMRRLDDSGVRFGIKLARNAWEFLGSLAEDLPQGLSTVILTSAREDALAAPIRLLRGRKITVLLEATCLADAKAGEAMGVDGLVAKGHESGGRVADETSFILLQRFLLELGLPVWVYGGIGLHTAAACVVAGAAGLILDAQLSLTRESPLPEKIKAKIASMDGSETICLGEQLGEAYRLYYRPGNPAVKALQELEARLMMEDRPEEELLLEWRKAVAGRAGWASEEDALMLGQDAAFAASLAQRFRTVGGVLQAICGAIERNCASAERLRPLDEGSLFARSHGTRYPILQGPMTRVSDVPEFAACVAEGGALPFLALALMRGPEVKALLQEAKSQLGDRPWGVGILGFVPAELRLEQMGMIREARPPFALIAGGRPDQARALEEQGTHTYLHVPSPGLLQMFVQQGARRFIFEGRECGGYVGPRTSFVLWNQMMDVLLGSPELEARPEEFSVVFAAGIHDALSSAMVAVIAAPLAERGVQVGVLIGTAYLFTEEAVSAGAIQRAFQEQAAQCQSTVLLETGPGHASRCVATPFASAFLQEKRRLLKSGVAAEEIRMTLEELNLGRLRIASKGVTRHPEYGQNPSAPKLMEIEHSEQVSQGMYMIGQVASLRQHVCTIEALHQHVCVEGSRKLEGLSDLVFTQASPLRTETPSDIAIIGMSCHLPKAPDLQTFWENILGKVDAVSEVPETRWSSELYFDADPKAKDKIYSRWGGFLDDIRFEPMQYGMPPSTLRSVEPAQLLTLEVVRAALKDAGYLDRPFPRERTSVIFGAGGGAADLGLAYGARSFIPMLEHLPEFEGRSEEILASLGERLPEWTEDSFAGILTNVSAGRVANRFDLGGSNYTVDAACASSLAAVSLALKELEGHTSDMVIVGGIDTMQNPFTYLCFSKTQALSPRGRCRTFDESADGIAISEGIAMMVFKRLADAERDGDRIYAVIKAAASSSDGKDRGLTAPRPEGQARALKRAYAKAGFSPATVGLIEAHGTGTVAGDGAEVQALTKVFSEAQAARQSCAIGSVKSMVGHTKCAAGAVGLMKAALALHHKVLPPTLGVEKPNPRARFNESPFFVNSEPQAWLDGQGKHPRRAGVSAFGFGGTNFHVVVEEYTGDATASTATPRQLWSDELFLWSGNSRQALLEDVERWTKALEGETKAALRDLAFTAWKLSEERGTATKAPLLKLALVARSVDDLRTKLTSARTSLLTAEQAQTHPSRGIYFAEQPLAAQGKLAFLFPGQGSQYPHMLQDLLLHFPEMGQVFEAAVRVLGDELDQPLKSYIFPPPSFNPQEAEARQEALTETRIAQPALGAAAMAMFGLLQEFGLQPDMMAGHSYGEYVALAAADAFSTEDLIALSEARGRYIVAAAGSEPGIMAAVHADGASTAAAIEGIEGVGIANANAPRQTVISGTRASVESAVALFQRQGIAGRVIPVACAFHSPLVAPAQEPLAHFLAKLKISTPRVTVYSNTTAKPYPTEAGLVSERLVEHLVKPVEFAQEIEAMYAAGARIFVEVGPRAVLTNLVDKILGERPRLAAASDQHGRPGLTQLLQLLAQLASHGVPLKLERLFRGRANRRLDLNALDRENREQAPTSSTWLVNGARAKPYAESSVRAVRETKPQTPAPPPHPKPIKHLSNGAAATVTPLVQAGPQMAPEVVAETKPTRITPTMPQPQMPAQQSYEPQSLRTPPVSQDGVPEVMAQFQHMMTRFLETQQSVLMAYLGSESGGPVPASLPEAVAVPIATHIAVAVPQAPVQQDVPLQPPVVVPVEPPVEVFVIPERAPAALISPTVQPAGPSLSELTNRLLAIVSERTGYPPEMLAMNLDFEADLGIDSIKRVEILGTFQQALATQGMNLGEGILEKLAGARTLEAIIKGVMDQLQTQPAGKTSHVAESAVEPLAPRAQTPVIETHITSRGELTARLLQIVSERTGYPVEMLEMHLDLEADLGIDSIKRVEILGTFQQSFPAMSVAGGEGLMEKLAGARTLEGIMKGFAEPLQTPSAEFIAPSPRTLEPPAQPPDAPVAEPGREELMTRLLQIVSERTGYPPDMLDLDLDLEADLGIDSIKRVEILGTFQQSLAASGLLAAEGVMEHLAGIHTLRGILEGVMDRPRLQPKPTEERPTRTTPAAQPGAAPVAAKTNGAAELLPLKAVPEAREEQRIRRYTVVPVKAPLGSKPRKLTKDRTILITEDTRGIAQALAKRLRSEHCNIALVRDGQEVTDLGEGQYTADFTSPSSVSALVELVQQQQGTLGGIVHLLPLEQATPFASVDLAAWKRRLQRGTELLFQLAKIAGKELRDLGKQDGAFLLAATGMGGTFMAEDHGAQSPDHGGVVGLTKTLALEWPEVSVKALDLNLQENAQTLVTHLFEELTLVDHLVEVGYNGSRYTLESQPAPLHGSNSAIPLDQSSVILITGGARGIAAHVALRLAERHKSTLILLGRSPKPEAEENATTAGRTSALEVKAALMDGMRLRGEPVTSALVEHAYASLKAEREVRANLLALQLTGSQVHYYATDVRDEQNFGDLIDSIYSTFGRIDGVIHAAGVIEDRLIQDKDLQSFHRVFDTKVDSAFVLSRKLRPESLKFLALFSSVAGRFGNRGQGDYAAANEVLSKLAVFLDRTWPCRVVAINWGPWDNAGMVTPEVRRQLAARGVELIPTETGLRMFEEELTLGRKGQAEVVVGGMGWEAPRSQEAPRQEQPLFGPAASFRTNGHLEVLREFDPKRDRYLHDHRLDGQPVVPLAVMTELIAETVAHEWPEMQVAAIRDLRVLQGVVLDDGPKTVRVVTNLLSSAEPTSASVGVEVFSTKQANRVHYRATVELASQIHSSSLEPAPLLDGKSFRMALADVYQRWLFHGPLLQGIERIDRISAGGIKAVLATSRPATLIEAAPGDHWLIDPLMFDSALQLLVVWAREHWDMTALPSGFKSYHRYANSVEGQIVCELRIRPETGARNIHADIFFRDTGGNLVAFLEDMQGACSSTLNRLGRRAGGVAAGSRLMIPDSHPEPVRPSLAGDVAIVGMSCLFAGAPDLGTYWRNIVAKVDSISDPPPEEWDPAVFYDPQSTANDRVYCKRGGYIGDLAEFRPLDFGVMPITVDGGEPDQWLALRVAHEALADAGYPDAPKEHQRTEVILGKGTYVNRGNLTVGYHGMIIEYFLQVLKTLHPEYSESDIAEIKKELKSGLPPFSADTAPALIGNIIAGRIANRLDLMGSSFTVDAACASALVAIDVGVRNLLCGKCDLVLAGGANANAPLPTLSLFCQLGALSRKEQIRPFSKHADGTILGEGLGMVVLKRREDAERDHDRIYALIKGVGIASDGRALHVMAPRVEGEELALQRAYEMAGFSPSTVGLIEAHGTATPVGDAVEIQALSRVFGEREGTQPGCAIGSVKSMIGHTMPAAGIAGVIKTALALYHRVVPPTLHCEEPNPALHLEKTPFYVNTETRPWIHGAATARRAGVNSFGFGGINGHVVLEEYPESAERKEPSLLHWETEIVILEASSRLGLVECAASLSEYLIRGAQEVALRDIAYTLIKQLEGKPCRLAIVAESREDLAQKLAHAVGRLRDAKCRQIKDNRGIYFFDEPLEGKLAFIFPGEGAQYPNMLLDLCLHFPEVRQCFDLADRALTQGSRGCLPSDFIFPRSTVSDDHRAEMDRHIWEIDGAVESVLIANRAMWTLLRKLEIQPDVIMGHSTGDYSAMLSSEVIELANEANYVETILAWNQAHSRIEQEHAVPHAVLVAVAADAATVGSIIQEVGGDLSVAMDNCPHQSVLVGSKEAMDLALEQLRKRGLIYEVLPFDRPYHTPMFQAYAEGAAQEFFSRLRLSSPKTPTYSCTTAALYPDSVEAIRELFIAHWVQPVLFTETIAKMYADGVRLFVETGPRGNLTAFVSDILRGKPHLAMPSNIPRRSGLTQLNHLVGVLAAQGVGMNLDYLYARRVPQRVALDASKQPTSVKPRSRLMKVTLAMPEMRVTPRRPGQRAPERSDQVTLPRNGHTSPPQDVSAPRQAVSTMENRSPAITPQLPSSIVAMMPEKSNGLAVMTASEPVRTFNGTGSSAQIMTRYMQGMQHFLDVEHKVMSSFLQRARPAHTNGHAKPDPPAPHRFPLLGTITSLTPGRELTALRRLNVEDDLFLREHALGGPVSTADPTLKPLIVLPLTMSMELLAEAAAALMPAKVLIGMRDIQAHHWIRVEDSPVELSISARVEPASPNEVEVQVWDTASETPVSNAGAPPAVRGWMLFADKPLSPPSAQPFQLADQKPTRFVGNLYDGRRMFHGPCFQAVTSVDRVGSDGVIGQLSTLPPGTLFRFDKTPCFVTDPIVLDAAGQLVGFWAAEALERGFVVFPYRLESVRIYASAPATGERLTCQVKVELLGNERMRSELAVIRADGTVWMQLHGWEDRRFYPPPHFHKAWTTPHEASISSSWAAPIAPLADSGNFQCYRLDAPFEPGVALWKDLWSSLVLSRTERETFNQRRTPEKRTMEWLSGRTAAKDAMRSFLKQRHNLSVLPADVEISNDEHGKPHAGGAWTQHLNSLPELSITHSNGTALALVGQGSRLQGVGIDLQHLREVEPAFASFAFTPDELRLLPERSSTEKTEWLLRLWCAKEAVAKALGRGLLEGPGSVRITSVNAKSGVVRARPSGQLAEALSQRVSIELIAYTLREKEYVVATSIWERENL